MRFIIKNWVRASVWCLVVVLALVWWRAVQLGERTEMERLHPLLRVVRLSQEQNESQKSFWRSKTPRYFQKTKDLVAGNTAASVSNLFNGFSTRAADMTENEKADLAKKFNEKFRPAMERWGAAYTNRIPFNLADFTLDKFHSTLGPNMFTFMLGDTTLTFVTSRDANQPAKVGYLMIRKAALDMNRLPGKGFVPNLNAPVTTEEVIRMVKTDSGVEFKPNEVIIRPTAKASAMNGGAFVDILSTGDDLNNALNYKISMVFDADGKLVNYERDPRF